jgi:predicted DNA-binding protein with PD1-like motif
MKSKTHDFEGLFLLQLDMTQEMLKEMQQLAQANKIELPEYVASMIEVYKHDPFKKWIKKSKKIFGEAI